MFKLRVSNTSVNSFTSSLLFGPGISVLSDGPLGSSGKKGFSPCFEGADAIEAIARYGLRVTRGAVRGSDAEDRGSEEDEGRENITAVARRGLSWVRAA
jgi:hypothetical protein